MYRKTANIFQFFISTLPINLAFSLMPLFIGGIDFFASVFLTGGYALSLAVKEIHHKNYYIFYFNNGISKIKLWVFAYFFNFSFLIFAVIVYRIINRIFQ